jgi:hypothetical protein
MPVVSSCKGRNMSQCMIQHCLTNMAVTAWLNLSFVRRVRKTAKSVYLFRHVCLSVRPPAQNNSAPNGRNCMLCAAWIFFEKPPRKFNFSYNLTSTGTLYEYKYTFLIISRLINLRMRNVSDKLRRENENKYFVFNNVFRTSCHLWDYVKEYIVERGRPQMAIWRIRVACWIIKATNTHAQYVILIAFPQQQRLLESARMLPFFLMRDLLHRST